MCEPVDLATRYSASVSIRRQYGIKGYGVYVALVGMANANPLRRLKFDLETLAWELREDAEFIKNIVEDATLFVLSDGYIFDAFTQTAEAKEQERKEEIRRRRSEAAKKAAATRKAKAQEKTETSAPLLNIESATPEKKTTEITSPAQGAANSDLNSTKADWEYCENIQEYTLPANYYQTSEEEEEDLRARQAFETLRAYWNDLFIKSGRKQRCCHDLIPSSAVLYDLKDTLKIYSIEDICRAFDAAAESKDTFVWQFRFTVRAKNVQKLLSEAEQEAWKKRVSLTEEQREQLEHWEKNIKPTSLRNGDLITHFNF